MLSCTRYRVVFEAREPLDLPRYLGSTLRGAFGHAFRAVACPAPSGLVCPVPAQCPYHLTFETSPAAASAVLRTHEDLPRPFVIAPVDLNETRISDQARRSFQAGKEVSFELVLIGHAQELFSYFVVAFREMNRIGRGRQAIELRRIESLGGMKGEARIVYTASENLVRGSAESICIEQCDGAAPPGPLTIEFLTQTRLKHEGRFVRIPEFQILFRRLLGRLSSLARFHCGAPLEVDFRDLIAQATSIRLIRDGTRWTRWRRYSSRQKRQMEWEGIVGCALYEGNFAPFWKFLRFGQLIHAGHGATFGLGMYRIRTGVTE